MNSEQNGEAPRGNQQMSKRINILKSTLSTPKRSRSNTLVKSGRVVEIEVNYFPINFDNLFKKTIYHMDVKFEPKSLIGFYRTALKEFNDKYYPNVRYFFDGKSNMYTTTELKGKCGLVSVLTGNDKKNIEFTIVTCVSNAVRMGEIKNYIESEQKSSLALPGEAFQILHAVLKILNFKINYEFENVGRLVYPSHINPIDSGEDVELWKEFFQNSVVGWKPFLNIDVEQRKFTKNQPLTSYLTDVIQCSLDSEMNEKDKNLLLSFIKGLKINMMLPNQPKTKRRYRVKGLLDTAEKHWFDIKNPDDGSTRKINVFQYFKEVRNYTIKYPNLPCLNTSGSDRVVAIPIELSTVMKQLLPLQNQTTTTISGNSRLPLEKQLIANRIKDLKQNHDSLFEEFGVHISDQFATIPAKILDQPSLTYAHNKEIIPEDGMWSVGQFSKAINIKRWKIMNMDEHITLNHIKNFESTLIDCGKDVNVVISPVNLVSHCFIYQNEEYQEIEKKVISFFNKHKNNTDLIVVIIPDFCDKVYGIVKISSELEAGILTQCIKASTLNKMDWSCAKNILLKINSKLNGINHTLSDRSSMYFMDGAIIFGADVSRPCSQKKSISIATVAASHDLWGSQYNMEWRFQLSNEKIILDLENIIHKQLLKFKEINNILPKKIIYFRGEGIQEFQKFLENELIAIRRACLRLDMYYKPPVTILLVQKQHNTKLFMKSYKNEYYNNIPCGTVVNNHITHPSDVDFYIFSNTSTLGSSIPTKYQLLWDDNNFSEDQIEKFTYYLCFVNARCTQAVSCPAPLNYARLAAIRVQHYIQNASINLYRLDDEQIRIKENSLFTNNNPMYFI